MGGAGKRGGAAATTGGWAISATKGGGPPITKFVGGYEAGAVEPPSEKVAAGGWFIRSPIGGGAAAPIKNDATAGGGADSGELSGEAAALSPLVDMGDDVKSMSAIGGGAPDRFDEKPIMGGGAAS